MHQNALDITSKLRCSLEGLSREFTFDRIFVCSFFPLVISTVLLLFLPLFERGESWRSKALHDGVRLFTAGIGVDSIALHLIKIVDSGIRHLGMIGKHSWTLLHYNRLITSFVVLDSSGLLWRQRFDLLAALATPTSSLLGLLHGLLLVSCLLPIVVRAIFVRLVSDSILRVSLDALSGFYTVGVSRRGGDLLLLGLDRLGSARLRLIGHFTTGPSNDVTSLLLFNMEELLLPGLVDSHDLLLQGS